MTQKEDAERQLTAIVDTLRTVVEVHTPHVQTMRAAVDGLERILGEAQSGPPHGNADGTIDEANWTRMRGICVRAKEMVRNFDALAELGRL